ncbi:MAG: hypothetical protein HZC49_12110 [Nitrospirae bacterium]|nr:hypothetical protein [Nitrospirota bacterium]
MILHAVQSNLNQYLYGSGSWKAVWANRFALRNTGLPAREIPFDKNDPKAVLENMTPDIRHVLIEYSKWPDLVVQLKRKYPQVKVHIRTHNAEAYQYFNRATGNGLRDYFTWSTWQQCIRIIRQDSRCRGAANTLLGINE